MTYDVDTTQHAVRWGVCTICDWKFHPHHPNITPYVHTQQTGHPTHGEIQTTESYEPSETNFPIETNAK